MISILLIEDDLPVSMVIQHKLEPIGATVHACFTWEDAVKRMNAQPYDIVSFDVLIPGHSREDAPERIDFIRAMMPSAKVVLVSGINSDDLEDLARQTQTDFLAKEEIVNGDTLLRKIECHLIGKKGFEENLALLQEACNRVSP